MVRTTDWRSAAPWIFRRRLAVLSLMVFSVLASARPCLQHGDRPWRQAWIRVWVELDKRFAGDFDNCFAILIAQFFGGGQSLAHIRRDIRRRLTQGVLGLRHLFERYLIEQLCGQGQQNGNLRRYGDRGDFGCLRQARIRRPCSMILRVLSSRRAPKREKVSSSSNCA